MRPPLRSERSLPLRKIAKPLKDQLAVAPYATLQSSADLRGISPLGAYGKGGLVYGITPTLIDTMVEFTASAPSDGVFMWLQHQGGAISHVKPAATAYFNRGASHNIGVVTSWKMPGRYRSRDRVGAQCLGEDRAADARPVRESGRQRRS